MFTLDQIKQAHQSIVKTGADFPRFVQAIIHLGVTRYETFVSDGRTIYYGNGNHQPQTPARYTHLKIATIANSSLFTSLLKSHQQGKTDFMTFCSDCANTGVEKWVVDTDAMTCTYYDLAGNSMLAEKIPLL